MIFGTPDDYTRTDLQAMLRESQAAIQADPEAFSYDQLVKIQAPMVRCSRPPFRKLCRLWGTDVSYTHMIMSESFAKSEEARQNEFALYRGESKLIVQMAGTNVQYMTEAAALVSPYCDAIDINCGCPQKWAMKEGIGSAMLEKPELTADMVSSITRNSNVPCIVKMRVYDDIAKSVEFARRAEAAGASWVTVHGRTPWCQPNADVRNDSIAEIRKSVSIPVVANGSVASPASAMSLAKSCGVGGVMSARGLLDNPACFDRDMVEGNGPPLECISDFVRLAALMNLPLKAFAYHILQMVTDHLSPAERNFLGQQRSFVAFVDCLMEAGIYRPSGGRFALPAGITASI